MKKRNTIIYWIATLWLALGMLSSGVLQALQSETEREFFADLGYPIYMLSIIGVWKILGVIAILIPKHPLLKEWAYAGFFFTMSGAIISHIAADQTLSTAVPAMLLLTLTVVSWYFRPADKKYVPANAHCSSDAGTCCKKQIHS